MNFEKENFLRTKLVPYLQRLHPATLQRWGKMNVQQMIEHFAGDAVRNASGRLKIDAILTPSGNLPKMREFLMSEKPFKENTKNQ
jgi:oxepin-CoA hydrolase/3-oxo-5,6-dehydrosuberyl-CoA semialdehyde dehydrogenase